MPGDPLQDVLDRLEDGEPARALEQLNQLLREEPYHGPLYALRALILLELDRPAEARADARQAVETVPHHPFAHYAAGAVALGAGEVAEAIQAAQTAQQLDPEYHEATLLEARARATAGQWPRAAELARQVATADPTNDEAAVLAELATGATRRGALDPAAWQDLGRRFPLNPAARTGAGWTRLRAGQVRDARVEFEQALALDPSLPWAREGLVLALKARNPVYAAMLRYFLWSGDLPARTRNLMAIGGLLGYNLLRRVARQQPALEPFIVPLLIAYAVFLILSWLADPLFNLLLLGKPETRRFLSADERRSGLLVGGCLGLAILLGLAGAWTP